jgi:hypothetical protein
MKLEGLARITHKARLLGSHFGKGFYGARAAGLKSLRVLQMRFVGVAQGLQIGDQESLGGFASQPRHFPEVRIFVAAWALPTHTAPSPAQSARFQFCRSPEASEGLKVRCQIVIVGEFPTNISAGRNLSAEVDAAKSTAEDNLVRLAG